MEIILNQNWQFRKAGDTAWLPATVPGSVHTDLLANKLIPDPLYADNEKQVQWIENEDWEYQTIFLADKKLLKYEHIEIEFAGLDTYADVYLNDTMILKADNMFRSWNVDVKKYLQRGENKLYIKFSSAVRVGKELMKNYPVKLPGEERVFTRKAQYQYGWDWGPRLVTAGVWKGVKLIYSSKENIIINGIATGTISKDSANLSLEIFNLSGKTSKYKVSIFDKDTGKPFFKKKVTAYVEKNAIAFTIKKPKLWWCNGLGNADLYDIKVTITKGLTHIATKEIQFGIRDIQLIQEPDSIGKSFYFKMNGVPVFAKGANMIPLHSFPSSLNKEDYKKLLLEAKAMNMNMIRVWGGGIYEDDEFYNLCDSLGIMVWQDFMFACGIYPRDTLDFQNTIRGEIYTLAHQLKYHPSVVLFCGNNEIDEGWKNWGWQKQFAYSEKDSIMIYENYTSLFEQTIPWFLEFANNRTAYHPSSPTHGWGRKESLLEGDAHYWGVWWGKEPFAIYNEKIPRFMSEYGFQGMPCYNSFKQFIPENELEGTAQEILQYPSIKNHQKHPTGYETITEYMAKDYKVPTDFEDYIYVSQLLQARGMQTAIEAHRRNMPYCMGTLFWQLNDCWPVTSWSVLDFYGNRKASYYAVKEKYQDVMISVMRENDSLKIYIVNDKIEDVNAKLYYKLFTTEGNSIEEKEFNIDILKQSSLHYTTVEIKNFLKNNLPENCVIYFSLTDGNEVIADNYYYFVKPKDIQLSEPAITLGIAGHDNKVLSLTSNVYVANVYLYSEESELSLSKNFFNMLPGDTVYISNLDLSNTTWTNGLRIKTLNEINLKYK